MPRVVSPLPERTRLFRLLKTHGRWTYWFLAQPTLLEVIDTDGIELLHPRREGRSRAQFARQGVSNHRWIVGTKVPSTEAVEMALYVSKGKVTQFLSLP